MESEDENVTAIRGSVMVYCTECGFANEQGDAFCSQCGSPLEQPEANPAAPASSEPPAGRPGVDHTKAQANAMMGSMDTAMPAIWWRLRISNCT
ncbi:zinc-ribbon domain-containing protein [Bifidobacterium longum]|uniref:zinc-ribbon domain-containing protein n=1 Tax=Bifidobacterium longum TaxID=216816 RepID=UPI003D2CA396